MKVQCRMFIIALETLLLSSFIFGQETFSASGQSVSPANVKYRFDAPSGWKRVENDLGYTMTSPGGGVILIVKPHGENDFASAVRTTEIDSTYKVIGEPKTLENGGRSFRVTKALSNGGTGVVDVFIMLSPNGGGVLVMALSGPANADAAYKVGLGVANTVSFPGASVSAGTAPASPSLGSSPWDARLANKHLLYLYSGNGYFEERHYYMCSNGNFYFKAGSGGYTPGNADGGSFAGRSGNTGRWAVSGSTLVLQYLNGNVVRLNLTERQKSNEIGLNGSRYFIEAQPNCR